MIVCIYRRATLLTSMAEAAVMLNLLCLYKPEELTKKI